MRRLDVVGQRFGRLVVVAEAPTEKGRRRVQCLCDCGATAVVEPRALGNDTTSCGCLHKEAVARAASARATHGAARVGKRTGEYNIWRKMKSRCLNPADKKYPIYGAKGVTVCPEWLEDFPRFFADMGPRPSDAHSIDRVDVNGNYEPGNCRWALPVQQARNKRNHRLVEYAGRTMPLSEACELAGVNYRSALYRINRGQDWQPLPTPPTIRGEKP